MNDITEHDIILLDSNPLQLDRDGLSRALDESGWMRDALICRATGVRDSNLLSAIAFDAHEHTGRIVSMLLSHACERGADPDSMRVIRLLLSDTPGPGAKSVLAWIDWFDGRESEAATLALDAMGMAPDMGLPALVWDAIRRGIRPAAASVE